MVKLKSEEYKGFKIYFEKGNGGVHTKIVKSDGNSVNGFGETKEEALEKSKNYIDKFLKEQSIPKYKVEKQKVGENRWSLIGRKLKWEEAEKLANHIENNNYGPQYNTRIINDGYNVFSDNIE